MSTRTLYRNPKYCAKSSLSGYTTEQEEAIQKLQECKDFYEMLGIEKNATEIDIKKAFKKSALIYHPDKNKAPGSLEAFKDIVKAFNTLSNPNDRYSYDNFQITKPSLFSTNSGPRKKRTFQTKTKKQTKSKHYPGSTHTVHNGYYFINNFNFSKSDSPVPDVSEKILSTFCSRLRSGTFSLNVQNWGQHNKAFQSVIELAQFFLCIFLMVLLQLCCHLYS